MQHSSLAPRSDTFEAVKNKQFEIIKVIIALPFLSSAKRWTIHASYPINPIALRKAKIVYNFGLSECNRVKSPSFPKRIQLIKQHTDLTLLHSEFNFIALHRVLALLSAIGLNNE